ncbi:MAG: serine/threonine protein kinase [Myxococcaceae bacterium]|nr:MAG: serine/threonine protein kinase [Myxococcaceae bacterium]
MALQTGDVFGRYELVSWLGRGGMAETWRAQLVGDAGVTKPVLIKKVLPEYANDEAFISMFISEARISATLSHGNVAQVFDFGRVDGEYFLAMEFVDGQPLHRVLKRAMKNGLDTLPVPVAVFIAMEMCRGLHYAHTRTDGSGKPLGIVHRDISPDNVLVGYEGQIKIVDFGIAKARLLRGFKTAPGVVKGKYLFFSPEQARGEDVDARSDVWATGVVLYELLCGKLPVEGPPQVVMQRVASGKIPLLTAQRPDLPYELNSIVMKALTPNRDQRFESSDAFGDALAGFLYSNHPRFSAMNVANLLRTLFQGDLKQEGREPSVPGSFIDEMRSWQEAAAKPEAHAPPVPASPSGPSRWRVQGLLGAGALLTAIIGFCILGILEQPSHPVPDAAPPPAPILPPHGFKAPSPPEAVQPAVVEVRPVKGFQQDVFASIRKKDFHTALVHADACWVHHPRSKECHLMLAVLQGRARQRTASRYHFQMYLKLAPEDSPHRQRITYILKKDGDIWRDAPHPTWLFDALPLGKVSSSTNPAPGAGSTTPR